MKTHPVHRRKKRLPKSSNQDNPNHVIIEFPEKPTPFPNPSPTYEADERRHDLADIHGIPLQDVFVSGNGVELFRNPATGGWVTKPSSRSDEG